MEPQSLKGGFLLHLSSHNDMWRLKKATAVTKIFLVQDVGQKKNLVTVSKPLMPVMYVTQSTIAVSIRRSDLILKTRVWEKGIDLTSKPTCPMCKDKNTFVYKLHIQLERGRYVNISRKSWSSMMMPGKSKYHLERHQVRYFQKWGTNINPFL